MSEQKKMTQQDYKELALKWAPMNYQYIKLKKKKKDKKIDFLLETKTDLIVPINLDGYTLSCKCGFMKHQHKQFHEETKKMLDLDDSNSQICDCPEFISKYASLEDAWDTRNMRKRLENSFTESLLPVAYYSIAATTNYYYILYSFFHANDKKHPNDMEGCLIIVERDGKNEKNDCLIGMITVSHIFFPRYIYKNKVKFKEEGFLEDLDKLSKSKSTDLNIGGKSVSKIIKDIKKRLKVKGLNGKMEAEIENDSVRALIQQETDGHGLYALGVDIFIIYRYYRKILQLLGKLDIIVYYPSRKAEPYKINDLYRYKGMPHLTSVYYELVDVHEDAQKNGICHWINSKKTFTEKGYFHDDHASPPWKWVEKTRNGNLTLWDNPAELASLYFEPESKPFIDKDSDGNIRYIKTMDEIEDGTKHSCNFPLKK